jgi:hypothetical protein
MLIFQEACTTMLLVLGTRYFTAKAVSVPAMHSRYWRVRNASTGWGHLRLPN